MGNLRKGDMVRLNSGSPKMTVVELLEKGKDLRAFWFGPDDAPHEITAPVKCFTKINKED